MISLNRPIDIKHLRPMANCWNAVCAPHKRFFSYFILATASLTLTACQSDSPSSNTQNQTDPQQQISTPAGTTVADLSNDSLLPPTEASLTLSAEPGFLQLSWEPIPNLLIARVYKFDSIEGLEVLVAQSNDTSTQTIRIPSKTHQRAWHSEQFRVELCDANDCVSSARVSIAGLADKTVQRLYPGVFIQDETFAQSIALNSTASLMAASLPVQGAIDLYTRPDNLWLSTQRISIASEAHSDTRTITLALSPVGDTLAALVTDEQSVQELNILERFGEAWFKTTTLDIVNTTVPTPNESDVGMSNGLSISADSNRMLLTVSGRTFTTYRSESGWETPSLLQKNQYHPSNTAFTERFSTQAVLKDSVANAAHSRLFTLHSLDQRLWLSIWENTAERSEIPIWNKFSAYGIDNVNAARDVSIHSDSNGERLALAGWELNNGVKHTPVIWHYQIPSLSTNTTTNSTELSVINSIRFPFSAEDSAQLRFSADDSLNRLVLGWQDQETSTNAPDAALISYQFSASAMRWLPKLELPEVFPTFAKHAYVRSALLSPDGEALIMSIAAGQSLTGDNHVGELLALQ